MSNQHEGERQRFTQVNLNVWLVILAAAGWAVGRFIQGDFPIDGREILILLGAGVLSALFRTWLGLRNPQVIYSFTVPAALYDLIVISLAIRMTGGFHSEAWLLYLPLLVSESVVIPRRWIAPVVGATLLFYLIACLPVPKDKWIDLAFREAMLVVVTVFMYMVHRTHIEHHSELAQLREQVQLGQERDRMAREFHDGLGHALVNSIMGLELLRRKCAHAGEDVKRILGEQISTLRSSLDDTRQTILQLHGTEGVELHQRIRMLAQQVQERLTAAVHLDCSPTSPVLTPAKRLVVTRVVQESLSNILKHARDAQNVWIELREESDRLYGCIRDDGEGFSPEHVLEGFGLRHIQERIEALGGEVKLTSAPGKGTCIEFWVEK
jgi:signal transduction histidine kinase